MSSSIIVWPIIKALLVAAQFLGINPVEWQAVNKQQQIFLEKHFNEHDKISLFTDKELCGWASKDYQELNAILKREGFTIELSPFEAGGFGVVSILDVHFKWLHKGRKTTILNEHNKEFAAVTMKHGFNVFSAMDYTQPIVCIKTKSDDTVWITMSDHHIPLQDFELLQWIRTVKNNRLTSTDDYDAVKFPMVDLDQEVNISWLEKMQLQDWYIAQALQQNKFKMNEVGAHVKSAVAIAMERSCHDPRDENNIVIDKPFYLWIERPGITDPIFAGYITEQHWKEPQDIEL